MHSSPNDASHQGNSAPLKRAMSTRHLVMISLGGAIGTGLFLGSGEVIAQTGPVGAIISYFLGGVIAYMVMLCLGELAVHMPESGSFGAYAKRYIGPGTGYTITWLYWLTWSVTLGTEFTAAALLMQEWFPDSSMWMWTLFFGVFVFTLNMISTKWFAESEFWLAFGGVKGRSQLPAMVEEAMKGDIQLEPFVTHTMGLDKINEAFDLMHEGKSIRTVIHY